MEKAKKQIVTDVLYLKHCNKGNSDPTVDASIQLLSHNQDKKTIARLQDELDMVKFKYRALFNNSNTYHIILNKQLNIVDFNPAYRSLIANISDKPLQIGENLADYVSDQMLIDLHANCRRAFAGETFVAERKLNMRNGQSTWWQVEYSPAYDAANHIAGVVFNVIDITYRKNHELKIELQNRKLRDISLMHSHEIRGPLCTLMGLMELIKMEGAIADTGYIPMMDQTLAQLDKCIRTIVNCANEVE